MQFQAQSKRAAEALLLPLSGSALRIAFSRYASQAKRQVGAHKNKVNISIKRRIKK